MHPPSPVVEDVEDSSDSEPLSPETQAMQDRANELSDEMSPSLPGEDSSRF